MQVIYMEKAKFWFNLIIFYMISWLCCYFMKYWPIQIPYYDVIYSAMFFTVFACFNWLFWLLETFWLSKLVLTLCFFCVLVNSIWFLFFYIKLIWSNQIQVYLRLSRGSFASQSYDNERNLWYIHCVRMPLGAMA